MKDTLFYDTPEDLNLVFWSVADFVLWNDKPNARETRKLEDTNCVCTHMPMVLFSAGHIEVVLDWIIFVL